MALVWDALYLGQLTYPGGSPLYLDNGEGNTVSENAADLVGQSFGSAADPLFNHVVSVTPTDTDGDGVLTTDYYDQVEYLNYDLGDGNGVQNVIFDTLVVYDVTITFTDGTTGNITGVLIQDWNGNAFLAPEITSNADHLLMSSKGIQSITIGNVVTSSNATLVVDRVADAFLCFAVGTLVETPDGPRAVETLAAGDMVSTLDDGDQPLMWMGESCVALDPASDQNHPIRICRGALGNDLPRHDLVVSPQHRVLVRSEIARRMTGNGDVLVPAKDLLALPGVERDARDSVTYVHLLFDRHHLVNTYGAMTESLYPGPQAVRMMGRHHRATLRRLLPDLVHQPDSAPFEGARPFLSGRRARSLVDRHMRNNKPLQVGNAYKANALSLS